MVCVCVFWLCCVVAVVVVVDCVGGCVAFPTSHLTGSPSMEEFSKHKKKPFKLLSLLCTLKKSRPADL